MKTISTPCRLQLHGRWREVVAVDIGGRRWTERTPDGRLVHHVGRLLLAQQPGTILESPKPCTWCRQPAITATGKGRAYHPTCPGTEQTDTLPDDQLARIVFGVARDLGAEVIDEVDHEDPATGRVVRCDRRCCVPPISQPVNFRWRGGGRR